MPCQPAIFRSGCDAYVCMRVYLSVLNWVHAEHSHKPPQTAVAVGAFRRAGCCAASGALMSSCMLQCQCTAAHGELASFGLPAYVCNNHNTSAVQSDAIAEAGAGLPILLARAQAGGARGGRGCRGGGGSSVRGDWLFTLLSLSF